jgi:hypothetical protein
MVSTLIKGVEGKLMDLRKMSDEEQKITYK